MAITIVGTPQVANASNGANVTLTFSTTPSENDVVVVWGGANGFSSPNPTAPGSGYTQVALNSTSGLYFGVWYKRMGASPDSSVVCHGIGIVSGATAYGCYVLRGVDTTTFNDAAATTAGITSSANPDCPSITTVTNGAWVIAAAGSRAYDTTPGTVSGYSNQYNTAGSDTNNITVAAATFEKTTAGAENPAAWSSWSSGNWYAITVAVRPASTSGWSNIAKINGIASSGIAKVNGVAVSSISKVNGVAV